MSPLATLPPASEDKLRALQDREREAQSLVRATTLRIHELSQALATAPTDVAANIEHELTRLQARLSEQQLRHKVRADIGGLIRQWLHTLGPNAELELAKRVRPKLNAGETHPQAVARLRDEIAALRNEQRRVKFASPTQAELKAKATEYVAGLARRGTPKMIAEHDRFELSWAVENFSDPKPDASCILAWVDPGILISRLNAQIDALPKPALAMTAKAKAERLAALADKLSALEDSEEFLIEGLEDGDGPMIARRYDASPAAILGISVKRRAKAATAA